MKSSGVRNKGKNGERDIANIFTEATGIQFRRTPSSGSLRTHISRKSTNGQKQFYSSDIQCDSEFSKYFKFAVEIKTIKDISYYGIMINQNAEFDGYWRQTKDEVASEDIYPVLCIKTNNKKPIAFSTFQGTGAWYTGTLVWHDKNKEDIKEEVIYFGPLLEFVKEVAIDFNVNKF